MRRSLLLLSLAAAIAAAQPTLTAVSTLAGGTEETPYVITYAALATAANESGDTQRFKITSLNAGTLDSHAAGSAAEWVAVTTPAFFTNAMELRWTPAANAYGPKTAFYIRANNGGGDALANNSDADIAVSVALAPTLDLPTAESGANRRTILAPRLVTVTEDTWAQFTFADLTTLTQAVDVDDDPLTLVITALGDGTLAKSSGGTALAVGATLVAGESLWWLPSADTYTKQGATADADEPAVVFATLKARKTQAGRDYFSAPVTVASTIDGVADTFDTNATGFTPVTILRGQSLTMPTQEWVKHVRGFDNKDRNATIELILNKPASSGWKLAMFSPADPITPVYESIGVDDTVLPPADGWSVRVTPPSEAPAGLYQIGQANTRDPASSAHGPYVTFTVRLVEHGGGASGGGGGGGGLGLGCGAGAPAAIILAALLLGLKPRKARR